MKYQIEIKASARKELCALPDSALKRVDEAILSLSNKPRPKGCVKLKGFEFYRIRVGVYRVIYKINDETRSVIISSIGHRKGIYKKLN